MSTFEVRALAALGCFFALVYALYGLFRHWHFGSSAFDLGIYDQAVWHLSRFQAPASSVRGFSNILGDHFSPIIAGFVPLYWIAPAPETLIVAQAFLFALSILPVFLYLRARLSRGGALALCVAYGFFWGLQRAAAFDVHPIAFAPVVIATTLLALDQRQWGLFWVAALALMLVKEDLIAFLTFLGLYLVVQGERWRGGILIGASLLAFFVIVGTVIPAFSHLDQYGYTGAFSDSLRRPWLIPVTLVTPPVKVVTALMWLAPFAFLSLGSPFAVLLIPFALSRFLSASELHWGTIFHYTAPLAPILVVSAGDGLARIAGRINRPRMRATLIAGAAGACVLLSSLLPGNLPFWSLLSPEHYRQTTFHRTGYAVLDLIPEGASVVAQAAVVPHLSQRDSIYMLDPAAPDAEFVIAGADLSPWPNASYADIQLLLDDRQRRGYRVIFEENGWTVLRRQSLPARRRQGSSEPSADRS